MGTSALLCERLSGWEPEVGQAVLGESRTKGSPLMSWGNEELERVVRVYGPDRSISLGFSIYSLCGFGKITAPL